MEYGDVGHQVHGWETVSSCLVADGQDCTPISAYGVTTFRCVLGVITVVMNGICIRTLDILGLPFHFEVYLDSCHILYVG